MSKKIPFLIVAAAAALVLASATAAGQGAGETKSSKPVAKTGADTKFVLNAAKGGLAEVEMGRLAAGKASSAQVKEFGQRMVTDHSKANDELKQIASQKGITLPKAVDAAEEKKMDSMSKLSGEAFDRAYMADMVADHKKDVAEFKKEASSGKDSDVKSFASKTLPTLQDHLKMAQHVHSKVAGKSAGASHKHAS